MQRRTFLQQSCSACLALSLGGIAGTLASCAGTPALESEISGGCIRIPLKVLADQRMHVVRAKGLSSDIGVLRNYDGTFTALLLRCTHAGAGLVAAGGEFFCPVHGSRFAVDGTVTRGPARKALLALAVTQPGSQTNREIVIHVGEGD